MKILWVTWKSIGHPDSGGAELVCYELCSRLIANGHEVTLLTSKLTMEDRERNIEELKIIRVGTSRYLHTFQALLYFIINLRNKFDMVIEEVEGGAPYFIVYFAGKARKFLFYHQLGRINWLYELRAPFSWLGYYILVPVATRLLSFSNTPVITVSKSTSQELSHFGFKAESTSIISEGLHIKPLNGLTEGKKYTSPTVLSHGTMRSMKRTIDQVKAFELAKKVIPNLKMKVSGDASGSYGKSVLDYIVASPYSKDIEYLGRTSDSQKVELMQRCHMILVTSIEEGWGLIVTETNSQGTPAVVYDVGGLRDSVKHNKTGIITKATPVALAAGIVDLLKDKKAYNEIRRQAWMWSKQIMFSKSYSDFIKIMEIP